MKKIAKEKKIKTVKPSNSFNKQKFLNGVIKKDNTVTTAK